MAKSVKVKLSQPTAGFAPTENFKPDEIEIKEPNGQLYTKLGEPRVMVYNATGSGYYVEQPDIIRAYLEACINHPLGSDVFVALCLEDAKAVKEALLDFFTAAEARLIARRATPSSSLSAA